MSNRKKLTLADIAQIDDRPVEELYVEAWGGVIFLRPMSGRAADKWRKAHINFAAVNGQAGQQFKLSDNETAELIAMHLVDPDSKELLLTNPADVTSFGDAHSSGTLEEIADRCQIISGLKPDAVQDAAGNSDATPTTDSGTD